MSNGLLKSLPGRVGDSEVMANAAKTVREAA